MVWHLLAPIARELTASEVGLIARQLPAAEFPALLDVCCGPGRHARSLVARGYRVLGIDANKEAIARARIAFPEAAFREFDMRELDSLEERFDGVVNLWSHAPGSARRSRRAPSTPGCKSWPSAASDRAAIVRRRARPPARANPRATRAPPD